MPPSPPMPKASYSAYLPTQAGVQNLLTVFSPSPTPWGRCVWPSPPSHRLSRAVGPGQDGRLVPSGISSPPLPRRSLPAIGLATRALPRPFTLVTTKGLKPGSFPRLVCRFLSFPQLVQGPGPECEGQVRIPLFVPTRFTSFEPSAAWKVCQIHGPRRGRVPSDEAGDGGRWDPGSLSAVSMLTGRKDRRQPSLVRRIRRLARTEAPLPPWALAHGTFGLSSWIQDSACGRVSSA